MLGAIFGDVVGSKYEFNNIKTTKFELLDADRLHKFNLLLYHKSKIKIMKRRHFANFNIAGFTYWDGAVVFCELKIGTKLRLVREENNKYDPKAVAIYFGENKLGFVPRCENDAISKLCEQGYGNIFEVRINRVSPEEMPENQIGVIVNLKHKDI